MKTLLKFSATLMLLFSGTVFSGTVNACDSEQYRQFDFWLGTWEVTTPTGKVAGTNKITKHLGDCTLMESYETPSGYKGTSFNIYDRITQKWHQTWVDNGGLLLKLTGGLVDLEGERPAMQMQGPGMMRDGTAVTHRITWTPNANGTVRQHWQASKDSGESWQTLFDGLYTKKETK